MPTTVNGVGTHYYGKKNKVTRTAACRACGNVGNLDSYETRLWIVFVFIPIIPLGRKRINDDCQNCRRHYVSSAHDWEVARQAGTSAAIEKYRREPSDEAAFEVHAQLIGFHQFDQAKEFRDGVLSQFPDKALLRAKMAGHIEYSGRPDEAAPLWKEALELDPELPEARVGVARQKMREGELDEARRLLKFLEEPGANQRYSFEPLMELAGAYQHAGRHAECVELSQIFIKAFPQSAKNYQVRKFIAKSEKALKRGDSILPEKTGGLLGMISSDASPAQRWGVGLTVVAILAAIGMAIHNEYTRRHRTLSVINATGVTANVQIDDRPAVPVDGLQSLELSEGAHKIHVTGPVEEEQDIVVKSGYFDRWSKSPVWIYNIGGEAIVADVKIHYAVNPREPTVALSSTPFTHHQHVDYSFGKEPPKSLEVSDKRTSVTKSTLAWYPVNSDADLDTFHSYLHNNRDEALSLAERKLKRNPNQPALLEAYASAFPKAEAEKRLQPLLKSRLDFRPIVVDWHRYYQELPAQQENFAALVAEYDALLKQDPKNSDLIYLRGRIEEDPVAERKYLDDAIKANPKSNWAYRALAYAKMCEGDWQAARDLFDQAVKLGLDKKDVQGYEMTIDLALGKAADFEKELRKQLADEPRDLMAASKLASVLAVKNDGSDILASFNQAAKEIEAQGGAEFAETIQAMRAALVYLGGDMRACEAACKSPLSAPVRAVAIITDGRPEVFAGDATLKSQQDDPWVALGCSIAYRLNGNAKAADEWRERAGTQLAKKGGRIRKLPDILKEKDPSEQLLERVRLLSIEPNDKSLLLADLALRSTSARKQYIAEARKFSIGRLPPYYLVKKALEKAEAMP